MILHRYIMITIIKGALITLLALVCLNVFIIFIDELGDVGKGAYDLAAAIQYTVMRTPALMVEFVPLAVLLGSMLSLGALAANSEIIAMIASGASYLRLLSAVVASALIIAVASFLVADHLVPFGETQAKALQNLSKSANQALVKRDGFWIKDESRIVYIKRLLPDGNARQVQILELNDAGSVIRSMSARSALASDQGWMLKDVKITDIDGDNVSVFQKAEMIYQGQLSVELLDVVMIEPRHMSLVDLNRYLQFLNQNQLDDSVEALVFWKKVFHPLSIVMMAMLAFPFLMGAQRQSNTGLRLLIGILLGLGFVVLDNLSTQLGIYLQAMPLVTAAFPTAAFLLFTWFLYHRQLRSN